MTENFRTRVQARVASYDRWSLLRAALVALLVAAVVPFVVFAVPQVVGAEASYVVLSGSMEPAISPGDVVIVDDVSPATVSVGDVITFGGGPTEPPTTHRVIGVEREAGELVFETKGDNNQAPDPERVSTGEIAGRVMEPSLPGLGPTLFAVPYLGFVVRFANTTHGFATLVVAPLSLLALSEAWGALVRRRDAADDSGSDDPEDDGADATDADAPTDGSTGGASDPVVTLSPRAGGLLAVVLAALAVVAGRYALQARRPLAAVVAVGSGVGALLLVAFLAGARPEEAADGESGAGGGADPDTVPDGGSDAASDGGERVVAGTVVSDRSRARRVEVRDIAAFRELAADSGAWVVHDEVAGEYALLEDGVTFVATEPADPAESGERDDSPSDARAGDPLAGSGDAAAEDASTDETAVDETVANSAATDETAAGRTDGGVDADRPTPRSRDRDGRECDDGPE
ncbi:signal peptidase I [Halosimplex pelagicum]|uniref:Signal peptidase I n=1 Tax=Halosimplex pelagicum TaxID=869886 RepID=A0A7D5T436_9EURY|nr:signal peptidase I [Halosimplex pelagicum]QLH81248.1 signal peptidase I [Halosimplex pelagicum]